jgi:hypothetical protein
MGGITTGTRLEQLEQLAARINHEIACERRRHPPARTPIPASSATLLAQLGVTARHVKDWAYTAGLVTEVARGRVALHLVEAYAEHVRARALEAAEQMAEVGR